MGEQLHAIEAWLAQKGEPRFRFDQIHDAWYRVSGWNEVTTLSKELREEAAEKFPWISIDASTVVVSPLDGTKKSLLTMHDGQKIESVLMPNARKKRTICLSSQIGCAMACTFCATGTMGLKRNLTVDEIVDQVRFWRFAEPEEDISNIVFMGMGEPLANYEVVKRAATILIEKMGFGATRVTVSTVGAPFGLKKILTDDDFPAVRIAFSLHAGTDEVRGSIVPTHKAWSMKKIVEWMQQYLEVRGNRRHYVTLEYVMLSGVNDMDSEARALVKEFAVIRDKIKLNLIPWNPTGRHLERSAHERIVSFQAICEDGGITTTIRYSKGLDIEAACGQLVVKDMAAAKLAKQIEERAASEKSSI